MNTKTNYLNQLTISLRDLHKALNSKVYFTTWFQKLVKKHSLIDDIDYILEMEPTGCVNGVFRQNYYVTLNAALLIAEGKPDVVKQLDGLVIRKMGLVALPIAAKLDVKTMSSLEIAALCGKEHFHVMRDIKSVLGEAGIDESIFGGIYKDAYRREQPCFNLPRRECDLVVSGYSVPYRLAIIDRWQELEGQAAKQETFTIPTSLSEALLLAGNLAAEKEKLTEQILLAQPKVEVYDKLIATGDTITITVAAKELGMNPSDLFGWLSGNGWIYKKTPKGNWVGYQTKIDAGLLEMKPGQKVTQYGTTIDISQVRVTGKGLVKLCGIVER